MDFISAATIAREQNLYLTTVTWYERARNSAVAAKAPAEFMAYHWVHNQFVDDWGEPLPEHLTLAPGWMVSAKKTVDPAVYL